MTKGCNKRQRAQHHTVHLSLHLLKCCMYVQPYKFFLVDKTNTYMKRTLSKHFAWRIILNEKAILTQLWTDSLNPIGMLNYLGLHLGST